MRPLVSRCQGRSGAGATALRDATIIGVSPRSRLPEHGASTQIYGTFPETGRGNARLPGHEQPSVNRGGGRVGSCSRGHPEPEQEKLMRVNTQPLRALGQPTRAAALLRPRLSYFWSGRRPGASTSDFPHSARDSQQPGGLRRMIVTRCPQT